MNKKQVAAFLKVLSKDEPRQVLRNAYINNIEGETVLVATNGIALAAVNLDEDAEHLQGTLIARPYIERWYKLATGKDRLDYESLKRIIDEQYNDGETPKGEYPNWQSIVPDEFRKPVGAITFNAEYMFILQSIDGSDSLTWSLGGSLEPVMARNERGLYIFMPKKAS